MICKKCGGELPDNSEYCNICGKKVKTNKGKKKNKALNIIAVIAIFLIIVIIIGLVIWQYSNYKSNLKPEIETPNLEVITPTDVIVPTNPNDLDKPNIIDNPKLQEKITISTGFADKEYFGKESYYFISDNGTEICKSDFSENNLDIIYEGNPTKIFFSNNLLFIQEDNKLLTFNEKTKEVKQLVESTNIDKIYINEDFVFYSEIGGKTSKKLFRMDIDGKNNILLKENIDDFTIDENNKKIIFIKNINVEDYDSKNNYEEYFEIENNLIDTDSFLTLLSCDFAGNAQIKNAEVKNISKGPKRYFISDIKFSSKELERKLFFILSNDKENELCVINYTEDTVNVIANVKDYYIHEDIIYFTRRDTSNHFYDIIKFDSILKEEVFLCKLIDYTSLSFYEDKIYCVTDNLQILLCDLKTGEKKGFFNINTDYGIYIFGKILKIDNDKIYLENIILDKNKKRLVHYDKVKNTVTVLEDIKFVDYPSEKKWTKGYIEKLISYNYEGYVFGICDVNEDGTFELIIGERDKNASMVSSSYAYIKNSRFFTYKNNVVMELYSNSTNLLSDSAIKKDLKNKNILLFTSSENYSYVESLKIENGRLVTTPILKLEIKGAGEPNLYYKYLVNGYIKITDKEYSRNLETLQEDLYIINSYDVNPSSIVEGLYFNSYTDLVKVYE